MEDHLTSRRLQAQRLLQWARLRGGKHHAQHNHRVPPRGAWISASDNPALAHRAVLRLTYGITPAVVAMSIVAYLLGMAVPIWLVIVLGAIMVAATTKQDRMLQQGRFALWMPAAHLNLALVLLTVWVAFSGGVQSAFVWIYGIAVAIYGLLWGTRWAITSAVLCSAYLLLATAFVVWMHLGPVESVNPLAPLRASLASYLSMLFLVAVVAATLREQMREIFREAQTDELTGLANRRALREALDVEIDRAAARGATCAIAEVEIDHFKRINDRFGHLIGDAVLTRIAAILHRTCRAVDLLARFGGDEFVILMPQATMDEALTVVKRLQETITTDPHLQPFGLAVSVGVAAFPDDGQTSRSLLEAADRAMYRVKHAGGGGIDVA